MNANNLGTDDHTTPILLGREAGAPQPFGFRSPGGHIAEGDLIGDAGEGHMLVIAPTGAGKGRNIIIPNLLSYAGPAIVIDPKGEGAMVTAEARRAMGQRVVILDPFGTTRLTTDSLNVLDLLDPATPEFESDCLMIFKMLTCGQMSGLDRFWDHNAEALGAGLVAYLAEHAPPERRTLSELRAMLCSSDLSYKIATILDSGVLRAGSLAAQEFENFLGHEGEKVRTSVRSTAVQHTTIFAGPQVAAAVAQTSFSLNQVVAGRPMTIYLVIPPHKLEAYGALLRVWVATLLTLITRREKAPLLPTLLVLDELAQLGAFPLLRPAVTLLRGYGVRCMLFLQDVSQLRGLFPADHATIVNNCASLITFGHSSFPMSREMSELMGDVSADTLFSMDRQTMAIRQAGRHTRIVKRLDYLDDPMFAGRFSPNRMARAVASPVNLW
jgi:type IV secretion system protein VirD4